MKYIYNNKIYYSSLSYPMQFSLPWSLNNYLLVLFIFMAPVYPMPGQSEYGIIPPIFLLIIFYLYICNKLLNKHNITYNSYDIIIFFSFILLIIFNVIAILIFGIKSQAPYLIGRLIILFIFILVSDFPPSLKNINILIKIYSISIILLSILVIFQGIGYFHTFMGKVITGRIYFGIKMPFYKAVGFNMSDGEFGIMVAPVFYYLLLTILPKSKLSEISLYNIINTIIVALALIICQSRSTFLGIFVSIMYLYYIYNIKDKISYTLYFILKIIILMGILYYVGFIEYFLKGLISEGVYASNVYGRMFGILLAMNIIRNNYLIGVGYGNATILKNDEYILIHNQLLDQAASSGIISTIPLLLIYLISFIYCYKIIKKSPNNQVKWIAIWLTMTFIHLFIEINLYRGYYIEHLPIFLGFISIIYNIHLNNNRM